LTRNLLLLVRNVLGPGRSRQAEYEELLENKRLKSLEAVVDDRAVSECLARGKGANGEHEQIPSHSLGNDQITTLASGVWAKASRMWLPHRS